MPFRPQIDERGVLTQWKDSDTGERISDKEYQRRLMMQQSGMAYPSYPQMQATPPMQPGYMPQPGTAMPAMPTPYSSGPAPLAMPPQAQPQILPPPPPVSGSYGQQQQPMGQPGQPMQQMPGAPMPLATGVPPMTNDNPLVQPGAQMLNGTSPMGAGAPMSGQPMLPAGQGAPPTAGQPMQGKTLRMEGVPGHQAPAPKGYKTHGFLDATSIAILLPTLVLLALIIAAAHKKRLFPWQTIRTFNPPSGLLNPREYERSFVCPPNLRRHGRMGKRNPQAAWTESDGIVLPFGFLARTHLPITIPLGRLPNKNMFIVAPSGSGKTTLMRAVIKALMAKPCVIIALEAKANDPSLDEKHESFKFTIMPEAEHAGFDPLYFNPLDPNSIHWNPLDLAPVDFASSIVQDINSLAPEEQHWAERDHGYIYGLAQLLKWGAVMVTGEDENGQASELQPLPCNPRGLMRLVNNRRNIVESLRRAKQNPDINPAELSELTQTLSSIIRTDSDWDKNIQGVRGRLRMFKNTNVLRCTEASNIDVRAAMHRPTVLIFGAPASMGPDAESLASCFVYQLQQALHTRYGTKSALPLFAFFDEYQTLNMDIAGRLSAIVRGANGGLTVILQNISQIAKDGATGGNPTASGASELKTIFSNSAIRVVLHNADESTSKFFSDEIGKMAIIVPGVSDHYDSNGFGIFPTSWNRIHSQQVVPRVDADSIKRMEKHHALVYLSPAGDPEFGELKPFMCDLRGIEEIARLHLLHNVNARQSAEGGNDDGDGGPDGGPDGGGQPHGPSGPSLPPGVQNVQVIPGMAARVPQAVAAIAGPRAGEAAAVVANGVAAAASAVSPAVAQGIAAMTGGGGGAGPQTVPTQPTAMGAAPAPVATGGNGGNGVPSERLCGKCNKYPGKGRFCIECGTFCGAAAPAPASVATGAPAPMPVGAPGMAMAAAPGGVSGQAPAPGHRGPLTSLHPDMSKYGVPQAVGQPAQTMQMEQQPGQQPAPRPQQRRSGIEF